MPKLSKNYRFIDLSDYGRPAAILIAKRCKNTRLTPIHITFLFMFFGLLGVVSILRGYYIAAGIFLIIKSILDAADGELSRVKNMPTYTGRYLDSIADVVLNFFILTTVGLHTGISFLYVFIAFLAVQFQGTLYNYYYVILRNNTAGGDDTSRIFEKKEPLATRNENQRTVSFLFKMYRILYGVFDTAMYKIDKPAVHIQFFPKWFMTLVSIYGLGFQLFIMAVLLSLDLVSYIIPFFIFYTLFTGLMVGIRKYYLNNSRNCDILSANKDEVETSS